MGVRDNDSRCWVMVVGDAGLWGLEMLVYGGKR